MTKYIYVLVDPLDGQVRYVGQTGDCRRRLAEHMSNRGGCVWGWVSGLLAIGERPRLVVVDTVVDGNAHSVEGEWISMLWKRCPLLNRKCCYPYSWVASPLLSKWSRVKSSIAQMAPERLSVR